MINKNPYVEVQTSDNSCHEGWDNIVVELQRQIKNQGKKKIIITVDCYHGTYSDVNLQTLKERLSPNVTCRAKDIYKDEVDIRVIAKRDMNGELLNTKYSNYVIDDYFDDNRLKALRNNIDFIEEGVILIHGIGAHKIWPSDILIYSDMSKWEILQRTRRNEISNIGVSNEQDPLDAQLKWSYFIDWKICDKIKKQLLPQCDYFLETNNWNKPKLASGDLVRKAYELASQQPLFMAPFFDPELWDQNISQGKSSVEDFLWGFNCDVETDNILLKIGSCLFETPAINAVYYDPKKFLGQAVFRKFGSELPLRFNFIDTQEEDDLALFVYPGIDYLRDNFNIHYHQCENFYMMDVGEKSKIQPGLKEDISAEFFCDTLEKSKTKTHRKALARLLNKIPVKKHDHLFVPAETIYKVPDNAITLHISSAPGIFKWNLYEIPMEKVGILDNFINNPPPLSHYKKNLMNQSSSLDDAGMMEESLAPQYNQYFALHRLWFEKEIEIQTNGTVHIFNLIEGNEIIVQGLNDQFKAVHVHYAETFVVPADIEKIIIKPVGKGKFGLLKSFLKS